MRTVLMLLLMVETLHAQSIPAVRKAVTAALPTLQRSASEFVSKRACVSCHHNILPILAFDLAKGRGFEIDPKILQTIEDKTFRELRGANALDDAVQAATLNDPTPNDSYLLVAALARGMTPDLTTAVYARRLVRWQRDGHWITSDFRPPHSSSLFTTTATAVRAIRAYMPEDLHEERDTSIRNARRWLFEQRPRSAEDASFRLMGLVWAEASLDELDAARRDLLVLQKPNGGWPQLPGYDSDAYSTGQALFALRQAGETTDGVAWSKGLKFLLSNQAKDGTWHVPTRMLSPAEVSPKYFPTGFPYGKDEFLSYAGSCWAVMALLSAFPPAVIDRRYNEAVNKPNLEPHVDDAPTWLRTALFGTPLQLAALLDAGLNPNSETSNGTSVLLAAALDVEKVRLLLARGANAKSRSRSSIDALTIASAHYGTAASVRALLDAGASADPPEGVRVRNTPLVFAAMVGDLENVKLLLTRGAQPSEKALAEAVTFGYPEIVRTLIDAGADPNIVEPSGINLVHWATITNRPAVIPVLAAARVPINDQDDHGFTPLMYAATIDFGDTEVLKALLSAGADRKIRNAEGRTPLLQARRLGHSKLAALLQ